MRFLPCWHMIRAECYAGVDAYKRRTQKNHNGLLAAPISTVLSLLNRRLRQARAKGFN
jgi:hypothetical protein